MRNFEAENDKINKEPQAYLGSLIKKTVDTPYKNTSGQKNIFFYSIQWSLPKRTLREQPPTTDKPRGTD